MSGGHFDYYQYHIEEIADRLEMDIADIEYARSIGKIKKKELYAHLLNLETGAKTYPYWLFDKISRYDNIEDLYESFRRGDDIHEKDGKFYVSGYAPNLYEVVVTEGEREEWADGEYHFEVEDDSVLDEMKKGLKILKTAAIYAQRIDWLRSGDDGEESFKKRLKEELDELESKPLINLKYGDEVRSVFD